MCSYWAPGQDEYLGGEIIHQWSVRQSFRREMSGLQAEVLKRDAVLGDLLYRKKRDLCKLGRSGRWSAWLKQSKIPRSTADRLVLEHAEFFGLKDELPHREQGEPLEGHICQAAFRTHDRLENMLRSPKSRMAFVRCLADLLGFDVEYGEGESVRLSVPPPVKDENIQHKMPNVIEVDANGKLLPVNYELADEGGGDSSPEISQTLDGVF
jgi:hypothetical protein